MFALTIVARQGFARLPKAEAVFLALIGAFFLAGDDIPLQKLIPGFEPNPTHLLAIAGLAGWLALKPLTRDDSEGGVDSASQPTGEPR